MKNMFLVITAVIFVMFCYAQTNTKDSLARLLQQQTTDTGRISALDNIALEFLASNPDTTLVIAMQVLNLSQQIGYQKGEATALNRIGTAFDVLGNFPKALEYYLQALKINEEIENKDGEVRNLINIGFTYQESEDYKMAFEYLYKAKALSLQLNEKRHLSVTLNNLAGCYLGIKKYDSGMLYAQQAYNTSLELNFHGQIGNSLNIMGDINYETGKYNLSQEYYRLSFPSLQIAENLVVLSDAYLGMAMLFAKQEMKDSALLYGRKALAIAKEKGFILEMRNSTTFLSGFFRPFNADSALFYHDMSKAANDSLFSRQKQKQIHWMAFDEKLRQREEESKMIREEKKRKSNLQYIAISVALIAFIILFFTLSRTIIVNEKFISFFGILALIAVFEFFNLLIHPYVAKLTYGSPFGMLAVMICMAALLIPLHHKLEHWITHKLVEKNRRIRLATAKKTIHKLEAKENI